MNSLTSLIQKLRQALEANSPVAADNGTQSDYRDPASGLRKEQLQHASQRSLESLISGLPIMVYRCRNDQNWTMDYVSGGSKGLTGYSPEEIINNSTLSYARLIHGSDRPRIWNEVQAALGENQPFDLEYRISTREGEEKWIWERGCGIFATNGELLGIEGYITDISKRKLIEERLHEQSLYDPATGLPNTSLFMDRLQRAAQKFSRHKENSFILMLLELDQFTDLQSKYGLATTDRLIAAVSHRLSEAFDSHATLSRIADNRCGILLEQPLDYKTTSNIVRQAQEQVLQPFMIDGIEIYVTASIGVILSSSRCTKDQDIFSDAAMALSRARALGGARYEMFDLRSHAKTAAQTQIETEIEHAMSRREMTVYWQPVISVEDGNLAGLESRLVWKHPRRGMLFAEQFVPNAEDTQLILPLWEYMLSNACEQMGTWQSLPGFEKVGINIEIFGRTLFDADSILRSGKRLLESKPDSFSLALGIPEEVLTQKTEAIRQMLAWLQVRNIRLILDSFGAGPCSLLTLKHTPIDMIRIDPSLIEDSEGGEAFLSATVTLAHSLGISVIADRIQTDRQLDIARKHNIDYAQGNFISPPVESQEITALVGQKPRKWNKASI